MRTIYGPNPIPILSPDIEIMVDALEIKEIAFTLVTNKKNKRKAKASSLPLTDSRTKILLVLRASLISKIVIASVVSKLAATYFASAIAVATTSKPTPLPVSLASKPKPKAKSFAQATKANNTTQKTPRFAPTSSHEDFLCCF